VVADAISFADHHAYPDSAIEEIERAAAESQAEAVLVTGKDRVKLQGRLRPPLYELPLTAEPEPAFWAWFAERLGEIAARHAGAPR